jgi:hypothetical protein
MLIKKLYDYLLSNGKEIALAVVCVFVLVFSLFHIIQLQQSYFDWSGAGVKVQNFFVSIDDAYSDYWSNTPIEYHFINVPLQYNQAWVFPVGLSDAIWFAFKNDQARIFIDKDLQTALQETTPSLTSKIFKFNDDGSVTQITGTAKELPVKAF